jgi:hypothetical protein
MEKKGEWMEKRIGLDGKMFDGKKGRVDGKKW